MYLSNIYKSRNRTYACCGSIFFLDLLLLCQWYIKIPKAKEIKFEQKITDPLHVQCMYLNLREHWSNMSVMNCQKQQQNTLSNVYIVDTIIFNDLVHFASIIFTSLWKASSVRGNQMVDDLSLSDINLTTTLFSFLQP